MGRAPLSVDKLVPTGFGFIKKKKKNQEDDTRSPEILYLIIYQYQKLPKLFILKLRGVHTALNVGLLQIPFLLHIQTTKETFLHRYYDKVQFHRTYQYGETAMNESELFASIYLHMNYIGRYL